MLRMIGASALLTFLPMLPMLPVQILVNNLLYDVSQTALGLTRLPSDYWWVLAAILAGYLTLTQLVKTLAVRNFRLA